MEIRAYNEKDKERLRAICKETAFENYKKNPQKLESVPIMFFDYFVEQEPKYTFVIVNEKDEAYGYIICATDYKRFTTEMRGQYMDHLKEVAPGEISYLNNFIQMLSCIQDRAIHFHIDMLPECQRQGLGHRLIDCLCEKLKADGYNHLSGCCVSRNAASYALCKQMGFEEIYDYGNNVVSISKRL